MTPLTTPNPTPSPLEKSALKPTRILARECPPSPLISPQGLHVPLVSKSLNEVAIRRTKDIHCISEFHTQVSPQSFYQFLYFLCSFKYLQSQGH